MSPRGISQCTREWILGEPSTDDPCFERHGNILRQKNVEDLKSFLFAHWSGLREDGRMSRCRLFRVLFQEYAEAID